jgi:hypothetical protein
MKHNIRRYDIMKKINKRGQIMNYLQKHPDGDVHEIAKKVKCSSKYVYLVRSEIFGPKKEAKQVGDGLDRETSPVDGEGFLLTSITDSIQERYKRCSSLLEERGEQYGVPEANIVRTAIMATALLEASVKPSHICFILACMKICRSNQTPGMVDHGDDGVNYLSLAFEFRARNQ